MFKRKLIEALADGRFHSGSEIGQLLNVSRAAVWKQVKRLESLGLVIHAVPGKGYQIPNGLNLLDRDIIISKLEKQLLDKTQILNIVDAAESVTDLVAEQFSQNSKPGFFICLSEAKILNRAKYGKATYSTYGAYLNLALGIRAKLTKANLEGFQAAATVAVLEATGCSNSCFLKWPSQIVINDDLLGTVNTLVKGSSVPGYLDLIVGIEIRVKSSSYLSKPMQNIVSLESISGRHFERNELVATLISSLSNLIDSCETGGVRDYLTKWRSYDLLNDRFVELMVSGQNIKGCARGVDDQGHLRLETDQGKVEAFSGGEVVSVSD